MSTSLERVCKDFSVAVALHESSRWGVLGQHPSHEKKLFSVFFPFLVDGAEKP